MHKFKKQGGGRGKPARDSLCAVCGIVWHQHPKTDGQPVKPKLRAVRRKPRAVKVAPAAPAKPKPVEVLTPAPPAPKPSPQKKIVLDAAWWENRRNKAIRQNMADDPQNRSYEFHARLYDWVCDWDADGTYESVVAQITQELAQKSA